MHCEKRTERMKNIQNSIVYLLLPSLRPDIFTFPKCLTLALLPEHLYDESTGDPISPSSCKFEKPFDLLVVIA